MTKFDLPGQRPWVGQLTSEDLKWKIRHDEIAGWSRQDSALNDEIGRKNGEKSNLMTKASAKECTIVCGEICHDVGVSAFVAFHFVI